MKLLYAMAALCLSAASVHAGINNPGTAASPPASVGKAQLNLGGGDLTAQTFINLFNGSTINSFSGGSTPAALDGDGYPVRNFSGTIGGTIGFFDSTLSTTGPWVMSWPAGRSAFRMVFLAPATISNAVNATVVNGAGSGNPSVTGDGVNAGSVTINWNSTGSIAFQFDGTYTGWAGNTSGTISIVRSSDVTAFNAGTYFTPEFISFISTLHPRAIRPMAWNLPRNLSDDSNVTTWAYRKKTTAFSFIDTNDYAPGTRCGGTSSFCTISVTNGAYTSAAASDTPLGGWVNGEVLTGSLASGTAAMIVSATAASGGNTKVTVNSTTGLSNGQTVFIDVGDSGSTTEINGFQTVLSVVDSTNFTVAVPFVHAFGGSGAIGYQSLAVTGKSGGAKIIVNNLGRPIGFGSASDQAAILSGNATFVYDSVLGRVLYTSGGISNAPPIEAEAQLANKVNANLWYNLPAWALDDYVTNVANAASNNLNSNLNFEFELGNESWNLNLAPTQWMFRRAVALGLTNNLDYEGLRIRQIHGNLLPATSWGASSRLERLYMFQAAQGGNGFPGTAISTQQGWFNGVNLVSPGTSAYQTFVGGSAVNYNIAPNRPIDFTTAIGYAPYVAGLGLAGQSPDLANLAPLASDATNLQSIATNFNAGGSGITAAIATIDGLVQGTTLNKVQTVTASGTTFTTPLAHGFLVGDLLRFTVTGGTTYSGLNIQTLYFVATTPLTTTFTIQPIVQGSAGSTVNAGSAGSGTTSVGMAGNISQQSIFDVQNVYTAWELMASNYDSSRAAAGLSNLKMEWYEGALEPTAPTTAQCTTIGVNLAGSAANAAAAIASAIVAWKNDASSAATIQLYYNTFMGLTSGYVTFGAMPHSTSPSQLVLMGGGTYALNSNESFVSPAAYKLYNGFTTFSSP